MALTGTHVVGDPGEVSDNNLRDVAINKAAADIATLQTTTVRLTGAQTIGGAKDFTTAPTVLGAPIGLGGGSVGLLTPTLIVETSLGVWSGDATVRTPGQYPIIFSGIRDPAGSPNGITTPARINAGDLWIQQL